MQTHHQRKENRVKKHHRQTAQMKHFHEFFGFDTTKEASSDK